MKRKADKPWRGPVRHDIKKDLDSDQLEAIGAICMAFNSLEWAVDLICGRALEVPISMLPMVAARMDLPSKIEIIRARAREVIQINESFWKDSLDKVITCKVYRDAIIHARVVDAPMSLGERSRHGSIEHVNLDVDDLNLFYDYMVAVHNELAALHYMLQAEINLRHAQEPHTPVQPTEPFVKELLDAHQRYQQEHTYRKSLREPPPPPTESRVRSLLDIATKYESHLPPQIPGQEDDKNE